MTVFKNNRISWIILPAIAIFIFSCGIHRKESGMLEQVKSLPAFSDDMGYDGLAHAAGKSLAYLKRLSPEASFYFGNDKYNAAHMIRSIELLLDFIESRPSPGQLNDFIESHYRIYHSGDSNVLFTGYFEPLLRGSPDKTDKYRYPVYGRPEDLIVIDLSYFSPKFEGERIFGRYTGNTVLPYWERSEIEEKDLLGGKAQTLAWVDDRIDLFFLQIQGSGKIVFEDGRKINVHYDSTNGRPYRSIGSLLIQEGKIPKEMMSMQAIRQYLREHPEEIDGVFNYNSSYVFFREENEGPLGALSVALTPGRSVAVDRRVYPLSAPALIHVKKPLVDGDGNIAKWEDFSRLVFFQDTGGAIDGLGRADLFWGNGAYAEIAAGHMRHKGEIYTFVLDPDRL